MGEPAVPGVEEIARVIARHVDEERFFDAPAFQAAARAVLGMFEPVLVAEKSWAERCWNAYSVATDQAMENGGRALAAEAALAGERERAADIAEMAAEREDARALESDDDLHVAECRGAERAARAIAAAIRAQGE